MKLKEFFSNFYVEHRKNIGMWFLTNYGIALAIMLIIIILSGISFGAIIECIISLPFFAILVMMFRYIAIIIKRIVPDSAVYLRIILYIVDFAITTFLFSKMMFFLSEIIPNETLQIIITIILNVIYVLVTILLLTHKSNGTENAE